jgi:hypothetical protein
VDVNVERGVGVIRFYEIGHAPSATGEGVGAPVAALQSGNLRRPQIPKQAPSLNGNPAVIIINDDTSNASKKAIRASSQSRLNR